VKGVGPRRAEQLAGLGVRTVGDLITHFPSRYEHEGEAQSIDTLRLDEKATVIGQLRSVRRRGGGRGLSLLADVEDPTGRCYVRWFHPGNLLQRLTAGMFLRVHGKVGEYNERAIFINPKFEVLPDDERQPETESERLVPVYPATAGLDSRAIARAVGNILPSVLTQIDEVYDDAHRRRRDLPPRRTAFERIHVPTSADDAEVARRRLAYDELLLMQLALQFRRRHQQTVATAAPLPCSDKIDQRIRARFPFSLTAAQDRAVAEIAADLARARPMNRLLQGDVGCGKTAVALYALLVAIANRRQSVLMAPTEILAEQHFRQVDHFLEGSRVRRALLIGAMKQSERTALREQIAAGEVDLAVGTHALLSEGVAFKSLGVVVVDEQHKFGVRQRASIRSKGETPHYLVMTATPIPRTLAMTAFGDLDVSVIDGLPPGRKAVPTMAVPSDAADDVWHLTRERLSAGEQAYIVYPVIDESDALPLRAATKEAERLANGVFQGLGVGLVHGRMKTDEKEQVMSRFAAGEFSVLVATTVIEVGIHVPNATIMIVEHAERMGLSQLHQLRGRVGRGRKGGLCVLLYEKTTETADDRLRVLCETNDGFRIAEEDLRIRGPGELLGTRQHGLPELKIADLGRDYELLRTARQDAGDMLAADPTLSHPRHARLRDAVWRHYADVVALVDVG